MTTPSMTRNHAGRKNLEQPSPGASSSSSPSSVSLPPQPRRPDVAHDNRDELFAALDDELDFADNFIDDVAMCESKYRESLQEPNQAIHCRKRMRDKTRPLALCITSARPESLVLPTVELTKHMMPEWQATKKLGAGMLLRPRRHGTSRENLTGIASRKHIRFGARLVWKRDKR